MERPMPIHNSDISRIFNHIADLLEIRGANPFRVRAYRNAARTVDDQTRSVASMVAEGKELSELPDIGDALAAKIEEIVKTGALRMLKRLEKRVPPQLTDGSLDLPDEVLKRLDFTVCSVHSRFDLSAAKQTERIIRAMDNPHFSILGHPTGRLIQRRQGYRVKMERIMEAALERGCFLEINAQPDRLDLNARHCRKAREMGLKLAISTDAHYTEELKNI